MSHISTLSLSYLNSGLIALGRGLAHGERRGGGAPLGAPAAAASVGQASAAVAPSTAAAGPQTIPVGDGGMIS